MEAENIIHDSGPRSKETQEKSKQNSLIHLIFFFKKKQIILTFTSFCILVLQFYQKQDLCFDILAKLKGFLDCTESFGEVKVENRVLPIGKYGGNFGELVRKY